MATTYTRELKPGLDKDDYITWNDETDDWDTVSYTWDTAVTGGIATAYTRESKPTTSFTKETKP